MQQKFFVRLFDVPLLALRLKSAAQGMIPLDIMTASFNSRSISFWLSINSSDVNILLKCSYVQRLFQHAMEDSRPKSVLFHVLSFCICFLDPKRLVLSSYQAFRSQLNHGSFITPSYDTVVGMLERLGILPLLLVDLTILLY